MKSLLVYGHYTTACQDFLFGSTEADNTVKKKETEITNQQHHQVSNDIKI